MKTPQKNISESETVRRVEVEGSFQGYVKKYMRNNKWTDKNGKQFFDHLRHQKITIKIVSPKIYAGKEVGILYGGIATEKPAIAESEIGTIFRFKMPEDFLVGEFKTIDEKDVQHLIP